MANITTWPSQPLDGDQWERNTWDIGTPITKEKLENLEEGIAVLATQMNALLGEVKIDPSNIILNGTRLDTIQKWIAAAEDGTYDFTKGSIAARLDKNNNKIAAIAKELGGTVPDGNSTTYGGTTRLDDLEKELCGETVTRDTQNGGYLNSRLDNIQKWITGSSSDSYGINDNIADRLKAHDDKIDDITGWITNGSGYNNLNIDSRLGTIEASVENLENRIDDNKNRIDDNETDIESIKIWITGGSIGYNKDTSIAFRVDTLEDNSISITSRLDDLEKELCGDTIERDNVNGGYTNSKIDNLQTIVGSGALDDTRYTNLTDAVKAIIETDNFGTASQNFETVKTIVKEIWGKDYGEAVLTNDSLIDSLNARLSSLSDLHSQIKNRVTTLEEDIAKIPIELYEAQNTSADDTIELNAVPRDKSIFFIAIPQGTLGKENLKLQTPDIQFVDEIGQQSTFITLKKNYADPVIVKYPQNSIISVYRKDERDSNNNITSSNAYIINMPMIL